MFSKRCRSLESIHTHERPIPIQICSHGPRSGQCEQMEDRGTRSNVAAALTVHQFKVSEQIVTVWRGNNKCQDDELESTE